MDQSQLMKMFEIVKTSSNPKAMLESMARSNPQLNDILKALSSNNMSAKDMFYEAAKQKGMSDHDIETFLSSLRTMF